MEGFGVVLAAMLVLVVVLARMARSSYLVKLWLYRKASIASWAKDSSGTRLSGSSGFKALIVVAHVCGFLDVMTRGFLDRVQVLGHLVNVIWGNTQSTSGLCARSQSIPRIMSWSPNAVT